MPWIKCEKCGQYFEEREYWGHKCGVDKPTDEIPDFKNKSHRDVLEYFAIHPEKIEPGLKIIAKELPIYKGRVDLVGRDKNMNICIIEIVHREGWSKEKYWVKKLRNYRAYLRWMAKRIFNLKDFNVRMILVRSSGKIEEIK